MSSLVFDSVGQLWTRLSSFKVLEGTLIQTKVSATKSHANNFVYNLTAPPTNPQGLHASPATQINTEMGKWVIC